MKRFTYGFTDHNYSAVDLNEDFDGTLDGSQEW